MTDKQRRMTEDRLFASAPESCKKLLKTSRKLAREANRKAWWAANGKPKEQGK
jgi:hypothetical protein